MFEDVKSRGAKKIMLKLAPGEARLLTQNVNDGRDRSLPAYGVAAEAIELWLLREGATATMSIEAWLDLLDAIAMSITMVMSAHQVKLDDDQPTG